MAFWKGLSNKESQAITNTLSKSAKAADKLNAKSARADRDHRTRTGRGLYER